MKEASQQRFRRGAFVYLVVLGAGVAVLIATAAFAAMVGVDGSFLTREPQVVLDGPLYAGTLSNVGALIWMVGAVMAFVGFASTSEPKERRMFLTGGVLGLVLLFDDFFMLHDWLSLHSRLLERGLILSYLLAVAVMLVAFRTTLGSLAIAGILITLALFGASIVADTLFNDLDQIIEDGFKFLGICTWATTWTLRARPWSMRPTEPNAGTAGNSHLAR